MVVYDMGFMNSNSPVGIAVGVNSAAGGVIGVGISLVVYFILIKGATDNNYNLPTALLFSSFILAIISGILLGLQLLPDYVLGINVAVLLVSIFIRVFGK